MMFLVWFMGMYLERVHCGHNAFAPSSYTPFPANIDEPGGMPQYGTMKSHDADFLDFTTSHRKSNGARARLLLEGDTCKEVGEHGTSAVQCSEDAVEHKQTHGPSDTRWCCEDPERPKCTPNICGEVGCQRLADLSCFCDDELLAQIGNGYLSCSAGLQENLRDAIYPLEVTNLHAFCCSQQAIFATYYKHENKVGSYSPNSSLSSLQALESDITDWGSQICKNAYPGNSKPKVCTNAHLFAKDDGSLFNVSDSFDDATWCCKEEEVCASCNSFGSFGCLPAGTIACECVEQGKDKYFSRIPDMCSKAEVDTFGSDDCCAKKNNLNQWMFHQIHEATYKIQDNSTRRAIPDTAKNNFSSCFDFQPDGLPVANDETTFCVDRSSTGHWCCKDSSICAPRQCEEGTEHVSGCMEVGRTFCSCSTGSCKGRHCCLLAKYSEPFCLLLMWSTLAGAVYVRRFRPLIIKAATHGPFDYIPANRFIRFWRQTEHVDSASTRKIMLFFLMSIPIGPITWLILFFPLLNDDFTKIFFIVSMVASCVNLSLVTFDCFKYPYCSDSTTNLGAPIQTVYMHGQTIYMHGLPNVNQGSQGMAYETLMDDNLMDESAIVPVGVGNVEMTNVAETNSHQ